MSNPDRITGKIIICATITNSSPILIGKGEGETDTDLLLWSDGRPYIPGSSLAGIISAAFKKFIRPGLTPDEILVFDLLWGKNEDKKNNDLTSYQSHIIFDDLLPDESAKQKIGFRDGVRIDYKTGIAVEKGKYDYQLVEPGVNFPFKAEITIRQIMDHELVKQYVNTIKEIFDCKIVRIGALGNTGFGKILLSDFMVYYFDFSKLNTKDADNWSSYILNDKLPEKSDTSAIQPFKITPLNYFSIEATFSLKSALITGSYSSDPDKPDKSQLKGNNEKGDEKFILSGKAIRGALRHRAIRILNTLDFDGEDSIKDLMGFVNPDDPKERAKKGRFETNETILDGYETMTQQRIKIDRFTGGTISGALFDSAPVWQSGNNEFTVILGMTDYTSKEAALLMHLLKDLWLEDLPIGGEKNVGRGVLVGKRAVINDNGNEIIIEADGESKIEIKSGDALEINKKYKLENA